jgi:hypothetical protein
MFFQSMSLLGAALILGAYIALQRGITGPNDRWYNAANFIGSSLLAWVAIVDRRVGFIVLESAWALFSIPGMLRRRKRKAATV